MIIGSVTFGTLFCISGMIVVVLTIAWFDFERPRHLLAWAFAAAVLTAIWAIERATQGNALERPLTAAALVACGGVAAALITIGFRQRAGRTTWAEALIALSLLPAVLMLILHHRIPPLLRLAPLDLIDALMLGLSAATLVGRRRNERTAQRLAYSGLLLLGAGSIAMAILRLWWTIAGEGAVAALSLNVVLTLLPATVTGIGICLIFLLTADLADQTRRLAATDTLTGLLNRRGFEEAGDELLTGALANGRSVALALVDIDHFKSVNDSFGHQMGDWVITRFAQILVARTGRRDLLARMGGEEFAILMPDADLAAAARVAEDIREEIAQTAFHLGDGRRITASFGVVEMTSDAIQLNALLNRADRALYRAKDCGRDRVMTFEHEVAAS